MTTKYFWIGLSIVWGIFGAAFYLKNIDDIPNKWKKHLARVISGPIVWGFCLIGYAIDSLFWVDNIYVAFVQWLKKP